MKKPVFISLLALFAVLLCSCEDYETYAEQKEKEKAHINEYIKKNDIRLFIDQHKVSIPVLQDSEMQFGPTYGTGYVPVAFLVLPDGTFYRYEQMKPEAINHMKAVLDKILPKTK